MTDDNGRSAPEVHVDDSPSASGNEDDEDDAFDEVDLDVEVASQAKSVAQDAPRARMATSYPLPSPSLRPPPSPRLPLPSTSPPRSPALGRLGMDSSNDAEPAFASTSTFNFAEAAAAAAREETAPSMQLTVSDMNGHFESVSLSREATTTTTPSARAQEKKREVEPEIEEEERKTPRSRPTSTASMPAVNGHDQTAKAHDQTAKGLPTPAGATTLEKVMSKTRQRDLPPKERKEDNKHLKEYSTMMLLSKENEKRKRARMEARRHSRDIELSLHRPTWEKDIVPNWKTVLSDANLRRMWWDGTMPARFRANLWSACIGNSLAIGKSSYARSLSQAQSHLASGRLPPSIVEQIENEMDQTLRPVKLFQRDGPLRDDLRKLLLAYTVFQSPTPRYPTGASWPAALLLISMPVQDAFVSLANLVEKSFLKSFYLDKRDEMEAYYRVFGTLLADAMPPVYRNFISHDVRPALYLYPWLTTCFARFLPVDTATRFFDVFLLEGDSLLFRIALALLEALEARLFNPDPEEIAAVFRGEDKGTRAVVARSQGLKDESQVEVEDVYVAVTGGEERIFELLRAQDWREGSWTRLVERELPE